MGMQKKLQCKHVPDGPILQLLYDRRNKGWCSSYGVEHANSIRHAFPPDVPYGIVRRKMEKLIGRGLADGCTCGCRGDYEITELGIAWLQKLWPAELNPAQDPYERHPILTKGLFYYFALAGANFRFKVME